MRKIGIVLLMAGVSMGLGWAAYQAAATPKVPLSSYVPSGALLYLQAKDFSALLAEWNRSPEKQAWMASSNYEVFSRSAAAPAFEGCRKAIRHGGRPPSGHELPVPDCGQ